MLRASASRPIRDPVTVPPKLAVQVPDDFPDFSGDMDVARADSLIVQLFQARREIREPHWKQWAPYARALVDRVWQAAVPFGLARSSKQERYEMIVHLLDQGARLLGEGHAIEHGIMFADVTIREAMQGRRVPEDVLRRAIELWPQQKQRQARTRAVREMARALGCDGRSLMTQLRQARTRMRDRAQKRRASRRTT
jgi:hypothetical protein